MKYNVYSNEEYLKLLEKNVDESNLSNYGEEIHKIFNCNGYVRNGSICIGFVYKKGLKKFYMYYEDCT